MPPAYPFPIQRYLTPDFAMIVPEGYTLIDEPIVAGLPHVMQIDANSALVLVLATGDALLWKEADPGAIVGHSAGAWVAPDAAHAIPAAPPLLLLARVNGRVVAATSLIAAQPFVFDLPPDARRFEWMALAWDIRAGSLRGAGDYGSSIRLVWRWMDQAASQYATPPIAPAVEVRQPPQARTESSGDDEGFAHYIYKEAIGLVNFTIKQRIDPYRKVRSIR